MKNILPLLCCFLLLTTCQNGTSKEIKATTILETTKSWDGSLLPEIEGQPKVTISKVIIPPQKELPKHLHPVITTGLLQKGELTITTIDNKQKVLKAGEVIVEVSNTMNYGKNSGDKDAEILVFYIGSENAPVTILKDATNH